MSRQKETIAEGTVVYKCAKTRRCYWLCLDCLKGHKQKCTIHCPDDLSIAKARKLTNKKQYE